MAIILQNDFHGAVDYGSVINAPGARDWFDDPYFHTPLLQLFGQTWENSTFAAKTTPVYKRYGNLKLDEYGRMIEKIPACIAIEPPKPWKPFPDHVVNAVGLSTPGLVELLNHNIWQRWPKPFFLSVETVADTQDERIHQAYAIYSRLRQKDFASPFALDVNWGCPNVGQDNFDGLLDEIRIISTALSEIGVPLVANFGPTASAELIADVASLGIYQALRLANSFPWNLVPYNIRKKLFGSTVSPLERRGFKDTPGGLSGPECLPFVIQQFKAVRACGVTTPVIIGNGIQSQEAVQQVKDAGVDAGIAIGIVNLLRPHRMRGIIDLANSLFGGK